MPRLRINAAVLALALLTFVALSGLASAWHGHALVSQSPCHICQAAHLPTLLVSAEPLVAPPVLLGWLHVPEQAAIPVDLAPLTVFGRAPPA